MTLASLPGDGGVVFRLFALMGLVAWLAIRTVNKVSAQISKRFTTSNHEH